MEISHRVFATPAEVARAAAEEWVRASAEAIAARGKFIVALSGGSTPKTLYTLLASNEWRDRVDWKKVEVLFGDERCVPPEHADSNFRMANEALLSHVPARVHRIEGELAPEEAARRYEPLVRSLSPIDLVLLGMGADGHTASLFPGTPAVLEQTHLVTPVFVEKLNAWRISLTLPVINAAREILPLVTGAEKADKVRAVLDADSKEMFPIRLVVPQSGRMLWLLDSAAAQKTQKIS